MPVHSCSRHRVEGKFKVTGRGMKRKMIGFLKHVVKDEPFQWNLLEGAKGVQLAELGLESWEEKSWKKVTEIQ